MLSRPERRVLPDGSVVELNREAEIAVEFTPARRGVRLMRGEAHFAVAKNPARPFVVAVGGVEVRAVGTAFAIRPDAWGMAVVVTEGRVAVGGAAPDVFADAGRRVSVPTANTAAASAAPSVEPLSVLEIERQLAWRGPRLELSGTPLAAAAAAFNRENRVQLRLANRATAEVRMSGVFRAADAGFARLL